MSDVESNMVGKVESEALSEMEAKLQDVWGAKSLQFCKQCGTPTFVSNGTCADAAPWAELDARQQTFVRWHTIQKAKADRLARTMATVAS